MQSPYGEMAENVFLYSLHTEEDRKIHFSCSLQPEKDEKIHFLYRLHLEKVQKKDFGMNLQLQERIKMHLINSSNIIPIVEMHF